MNPCFERYSIGYERVHINIFAGPQKNTTSFVLESKPNTIPDTSASGVPIGTWCAFKRWFDGSSTHNTLRTAHCAHMETLQFEIYANIFSASCITETGLRSMWRGFPVYSLRSDCLLIEKRIRNLAMFQVFTDVSRRKWCRRLLTFALKVWNAELWAHSLCSQQFKALRLFAWSQTGVDETHWVAHTLCPTYDRTDMTAAKFQISKILCLSIETANRPSTVP